MKSIQLITQLFNASVAGRGFMMAIAVFAISLFPFQKTLAQNKDLVVRIAKLTIDSAQVEKYKEILKEHAEIAVKAEPGVLNLYAVYEKANPTHVTVFEIYANQAAYLSHLQTPHFKKYKTGTKDMVRSLELVEVTPIALVTKYK